LVEGHHVLGQAGVQKAINPGGCLLYLGCNHEQIRIGEAIPIATGSGAKEQELQGALGWIIRTDYKLL
jgi:hypothetical protein